MPREFKAARSRRSAPEGAGQAYKGSGGDAGQSLLESFCFPPKAGVCPLKRRGSSSDRPSSLFLALPCSPSPRAPTRLATSPAGALARLASSPPAESAEGYTACAKGVHLADVPCAGPNENYRAARGTAAIHARAHRDALHGRRWARSARAHRGRDGLAAARREQQVRRRRRRAPGGVPRRRVRRRVGRVRDWDSPDANAANPSTRRTDISVTAFTRRGTPTSCASAGEGPNALETLRGPLRWTPSSRRWEERVYLRR